MGLTVYDLVITMLIFVQIAVGFKRRKLTQIAVKYVQREHSCDSCIVHCTQSRARLCHLPKRMVSLWSDTHGGTTIPVKRDTPRMNRLRIEFRSTV